MATRQNGGIHKSWQSRVVIFGLYLVLMRCKCHQTSIPMAKRDDSSIHVSSRRALYIKPNRISWPTRRRSGSSTSALRLHISDQ